MPINPFMTVRRDQRGILRIHGTNANTSEAENALNSDPLLSEDEAEALLFQSERDDLPDYDPNGDEP